MHAGMYIHNILIDTWHSPQSRGGGGRHGINRYCAQVTTTSDPHSALCRACHCCVLHAVNLAFPWLFDVSFALTSLLHGDPGVECVEFSFFFPPGHNI